MLFIIQILLAIFFFFALIKTRNRFQAGELTKKDAMLWSVFWAAAIIVVLLPNSTARVAELVGIGRGADLVVYVALAGIFFIIFRLMVRIETLNKDITTLTRKISLNDASDLHKDKSV